MALIFIIYPNWEGYKVPIPPQNCIIAVAIYIHKWVARHTVEFIADGEDCCNLHTQVGCQSRKWSTRLTKPLLQSTYTSGLPEYAWNNISQSVKLQSTYTSGSPAYDLVWNKELKELQSTYTRCCNYFINLETNIGQYWVTVLFL